MPSDAPEFRNFTGVGIRRPILNSWRADVRAAVLKSRRERSFNTDCKISGEGIQGCEAVCGCVSLKSKRRSPKRLVLQLQGLPAPEDRQSCRQRCGSRRMDQVRPCRSGGDEAVRE